MPTFPTIATRADNASIHIHIHVYVYAYAYDYD